MAAWDVWNSTVFDLTSLTAAINKLPYKPSKIGEMGLFATRGVATTTVTIEERQGQLALVPTVRRGGPATPASGSKRKARALTIPHIPYEDAIYAEDVQNVRKFGSESQLDSVASVVNDRLASMKQDLEVTEEYHRIGALHGHIKDSDGSTTIYNLFTEFVADEETVDFAFTTSTTDVRKAVVDVKRYVEEGLGATPYQGLHCFCGNNWWDAFIGHDNVKTAFERWQDGQALRQDYRFTGFSFAGCTFENYRGSVSGVDFINTNQARFFPVGVPNLFVTYYAPADFMETANTIGLPIYAKKERMDFDRGMRLHVQKNPLCLCLRPKCLVKGTKS